MKALLVIDMLNDFFDPKGALYCGDGARRIIPAVRALVDRFRAEGHAVIYLTDAHAEDDKEFEMFAPHAVKGSRGARIIPELTPPEGAVVVEKTRFSAFHRTRLDEVLASVAPEEVWVAGVCTSICVMDTVGDLKNRDYAVVVPEEAVADLDPEFHAFALRRMARVYGARIVKA